MKFYSIKIGNIKRELPIVALSPKMKVASLAKALEEAMPHVVGRGASHASD